jgi:hypothetical protein
LTRQAISFRQVNIPFVEEGQRSDPPMSSRELGRLTIADRERIGGHEMILYWSEGLIIR